MSPITTLGAALKALDCKINEVESQLAAVKNFELKTMKSGKDYKELKKAVSNQVENGKDWINLLYVDEDGRKAVICITAKTPAELREKLKKFAYDLEKEKESLKAQMEDIEPVLLSANEICETIRAKLESVPEASAKIAMSYIKSFLKFNVNGGEYFTK